LGFHPSVGGDRRRIYAGNDVGVRNHLARDRASRSANLARDRARGRYATRCSGGAGVAVGTRPRAVPFLGTVAGLHSKGVPAPHRLGHVLALRFLGRQQGKARRRNRSRHGRYSSISTDLASGRGARWRHNHSGNSIVWVGPRGSLPLGPTRNRCQAGGTASKAVGGRNIRIEHLPRLDRGGRFFSHPHQTGGPAAVDHQARRR